MSKARAVELLAAALRKPVSAVTSAVQLTGGQSNLTYRCAVASDPRRSYAVRIYGTGTAQLTDRVREQQVLRVLRAHDLGGCLETFDEGHVAEYVPGRPLDRMEMRDQVMSGRIASTLARLHSVQLPEGRGESMLACTLGAQGTLRRWIEVARKTCAADQELLAALECRTGQLAAAVEECATRSDGWAYDGMRVLCHNDLTVGNVLLDGPTGGLAFIDFEHAGENCAAFDIGNHFCQLMQAPEFPASSYPSLELRAAFVDAYLRARAEDDSDGPAASAGARAALLRAADAFSLASHLQWATWCTVQAALSTIAYDFARCARNLLECHDARRPAAFPLPVSAWPQRS